MAFLDKLGKVAFDTLDKAAQAAERASAQAKKHVNPLIDKSKMASKLRDRVVTGKDDDFVVPEPEPNVSPFAAAASEPDPPLAKPELPAQIYGRATDPWTTRSAQLLRDRGIEHEMVDLEGEGGLQLEARLMRETGQQAAPFVYLRGELVGGFNALNEIDRLGQLEHMCTPAEERKQGRVRVEIARRGGDDVPPGERGGPSDRK